MNIFRILASHLLSTIGTVYTLACVWESNVTFSRVEAQKIDNVLEICHHYFLFNKVGKSENFFLDYVLYICMCNLLLPLLWLKVCHLPQCYHRGNNKDHLGKCKIFYWSTLKFENCYTFGICKYTFCV